MSRLILILVLALAFVNNAFAEETANQIYQKIDETKDHYLSGDLQEIQQEMQKTQEAIDVLAEMENVLKQNSEFMYNLCLLFYYNKKIPSEQAIPVCQCEAKAVDNTLPLEEVIYIRENITNWDFLLYKKDEKALSIDEKYKKIRGDCIDSYIQTIKK